MMEYFRVIVKQLMIYSAHEEIYCVKTTKKPRQCAYPKNAQTEKPR